MIACPACGHKWTGEGIEDAPTPNDLTLRLVNALVSVNTSLQRNTALMERLERKLDSYDRLAGILERIETKLAEQYKEAV